MLYLGIDQHARQITISLRDESGDVLLARQVSTQPEKVHAFFQQLTRERLRDGESFVAVLEVCGFNDWLIRMLRDYRCHKVILIQPEDRKKRKTDRRDAAALSELLWVNRDRLLHGKPVRGLRQVDIASAADQENRRLTTLRKEAGQARTRLINKVRHILRRHNLQWEMPTKTLPDQGGHRLAEAAGLARDRPPGDEPPARRPGAGRAAAEGTGAGDRPAFAAISEVAVLSSMPGVGRVHGPVPGVPGRPGRAVPAGPQPGQLLGAHARLPQQRGERPAAGQHHQGRQRHGPVAAGPGGAQGAAQGRPAAGVVQADQAAAGATIARVAVMRKLATIIWHMLSKRKTYAECRELAAA